MITLTTFADARQAFRPRELRQALYDAGEHLMTGVIVNLHGEPHIARRRLENRLFRRDTFAWYEAERIPAIVESVLAPTLAAGHGDLLPLARRTMMTLSIDVAGIDVDAGDFDRFYELMDRLARASTVAHTVGDTARVIADGADALTTFESEFFRPSLTRREAMVAAVERGALDEESLLRDVLTTLIRNQDRLELSDADVLREIAYYPWVGSHSTSAQLVHAMHHLFEWVSAHPGDRARLVDDDEMRQRFVHESLRLHPASPVALRIATTDLELHSGMVLPRGETVAIDVHRANRDAEVFGVNADRFNPFRTVAQRVAPWGLSFGHGTHACLGQELAGGMAPDDVNEQHLLGAVTLMAGAMLAAGASPDPDDPPRLDEATTRVMWGRYPVVFRPRRDAGWIDGLTAVGGVTRGWSSVARVSSEHAQELLKDAGLSGYEAKAYLALLAGDEPMNGYEVAKASGVPRSTVYETLGKLVARGAAFEVNGDGETVSYVALPSEALIGRLRRQTQETIAGLEAVLPTIGAVLTARVVQHVTGHSEMIERATDVIESARRTLWLSIWSQEASAFVHAVEGAVERGVNVFTVAYGDVGPMPGRVFAHSFSAPEVVEQRLECRLSIVVADHEQALIGGVMADAVWGVWSDDRAVSLLAAEHVRHDIALQLTAEHLAAAGLHDFWANDADLEAFRDASALAMGANRPDF